jgi:hypothetical protein
MKIFALSFVGRVLVIPIAASGCSALVEKAQRRLHKKHVYVPFARYTKATDSKMIITAPGVQLNKLLFSALAIDR